MVSSRSITKIKNPYSLTRISSSYGLRNKKEFRIFLILSNKFKTLIYMALKLDNLLKKRKLIIKMWNLFQNFGILESTSFLITPKKILSLDIKDFLKRRIQYLVYSKGITKTIYHARYLIIHKKIVLNG